MSWFFLVFMSAEGRSRAFEAFVLVTLGKLAIIRFPYKMFGHFPFSLFPPGPRRIIEQVLFLLAQQRHGPYRLCAL